MAKQRGCNSESCAKFVKHRSRSLWSKVRPRVEYQSNNTRSECLRICMLILTWVVAVSLDVSLSHRWFSKLHNTISKSSPASRTICRGLSLFLFLAFPYSNPDRRGHCVSLNPDGMLDARPQRMSFSLWLFINDLTSTKTPPSENECGSTTLVKLDRYADGGGKNSLFFVFFPSVYCVCVGLFDISSESLLLLPFVFSSYDQSEMSFCLRAVDSQERSLLHRRRLSRVLL